MSATLDITKDVCPLTFVKVKMALSALPPTAILVVRLRAEALKNVIGSLKSEGHRVVSADREEPFFVLRVEKAAQ